LSCIFCLCFASHAQSITTLSRSLALAVSTRSYTFVLLCVYCFICFYSSVKISELFINILILMNNIFYIYKIYIFKTFIKMAVLCSKKDCRLGTSPVYVKRAFNFRRPCRAAVLCRCLHLARSHFRPLSLSISPLSLRSALERLSLISIN